MIPSETTRTWSLPCTVDRRCAMMRTVLPALTRSRACCTRPSLSASSALVASSSSSTRGLHSSARAMAMRCFWPPDNRTPRSPTLVA
mmetsp:Transcript_17526/g.52602  ORF Transcript_17526/g.52602 Transcript_17526/m.52602 type:complete len:87 (-) Transcript_17526:1938-2198(-)